MNYTIIVPYVVHSFGCVQKGMNMSGIILHIDIIYHCNAPTILLLFISLVNMNEFNMIVVFVRKI